MLSSDEMDEGWYKGTGLLPVTSSMIAKGASECTEIEAGFLEALPLVKFLPVGYTEWDALQGALQSEAYKAGTEDPATLLAQIQAMADAQA